MSAADHFASWDAPDCRALGVRRRGACISLLTRVRGRIAEPEHHTTGAYARDADGEPVEPSDPYARCWCLIGAVMAEPLSTNGPQESHLDAHHALQVVVDPTEEVAISEVSDRLGHVRALRIVDEALVLLRRSL